MVYRSGGRVRQTWRKVYRRLYRLWYRLVILKSSPRKVALGFALGVFIGLTPTMGIQMIITVPLAAVLGVNPISAVAGTYVSNAFTFVPLYVFCYWVGKHFLSLLGLEVGAGLHLDRIRNVSALREFLDLLRSGGGTVLRWMAVEFVGSLIVGPIMAVPSYFVVLFLLVRFRSATLKRRTRRMRERMEAASPTAAEQAAHGKPPGRGHGPA